MSHALHNSNCLSQGRCVLYNREIVKNSKTEVLFRAQPPKTTSSNVAPMVRCADAKPVKGSARSRASWRLMGWARSPASWHLWGCTPASAPSSRGKGRSSVTMRRALQELLKR